MTRGMKKAQEPSKDISTKKALKIIGRATVAGLAAGIALIAATDKVMTKAFPKKEEAGGEEE